MSSLLIEDFISINKKILRLVGLYPSNGLRYVTCLFFMSLLFVPEIFEIYFNRNDFDVVLETSSIVLTTILATSKSIIWMVRKGTPELIHFLINDYWNLLTSMGESEDIYRYIKITKTITFAYAFAMGNALLIFYSLPFININGSANNSKVIEKSPYPFPAAYPEFCYHSPFYEFIYLSHITATSICGLIILVTDTMIATALLITCAHFFVLKKNISKIDCEKSGRNSWNYVNYQLNIVVQHHQIILRFCDEMEMLFNPLMLLQVLASSLLICLVGFEINSIKVDKMAQYCSYLMMAIFQLLLFCWPGDELISQSSSVSAAAYSSRWYKSPNSTKQKLCLIINRSQKSSFLSAGKFSPMNLESFCRILSNSLSYFMLLRSVSEEE